MKNWLIASGLVFAVFSNFTYANEISQSDVTQLPMDEHEFVHTVGKLDKAKIIALLGEPAKAEDVKLKDSGRVVASIWHYHFINTDVNGSYYETTELDFIDDQVNVVVFLNNDGSDQTTGDRKSVV